MACSCLFSDAQPILTRRSLKAKGDTFVIYLPADFLEAHDVSNINHLSSEILDVVIVPDAFLSNIVRPCFLVNFLV